MALTYNEGTRKSGGKGYDTSQKAHKKRLKTFLTTYKKSDGVFGWKIKAYDFEEAEIICKRINHKLEGKEVKV